MTKVLETWQMCSHGDFASICDTFTCWLSRRVLKLRFLESGLSKIFTVPNLGNTLAMTIILFFKMFKIWRRFQKWIKKLRKMFCFWDNCIWIGSCKFSQSWTGYLPPAVNLLRNTTKTSPNTRGHIFQINFPQNDEKTWQKCSHGDFASISDVFTCWLSKRVLKRRFLESGLRKIFTVSNYVYVYVYVCST